MLKANIISYFNLNSGIFLKNYLIAVKSADVDAVHEMRVSLKRIDTLLRMLNYTEKSNYRLKKCFNPLKSLFKLAGPLRDFQVQLILLDEIKTGISIDEIIINEFKAKKNQLVERFILNRELINLFQIKRNFNIVKRYIDSIEEKRIANKILKFQVSRIKLLSHFSNKHEKLFNLHNARKMLKDLGYLIEMANQKPLPEIPQYTTYRETGHYLGTWHDRDVMIKYLDKLGLKSKITSDKYYSLYYKVKEQREILQMAYFEKYHAWENA